MHLGLSLNATATTMIFQITLPEASFPTGSYRF